jgi:outer membrane protein
MLFRSRRHGHGRALLAVLLSTSAAAGQGPALAPASAGPAPAVPTPPDDTPTPPAIAIPGVESRVIERVTLDLAVQRAIASNPTALLATQEIRRSRALMEEIRASSLPTLTGVATYTRLDKDRLSNGTVLAAEGSINLNAALDAPLVSPRAWVRWGQAVDQIDVARANAADVARSVGIATARAYLAIIEQKRLIDTALTARDNARSHFDFTRAQLVGGVGSRLDEVRAAQVLTADEVNLQNQEVNLFRAREALGVLVASDGALDASDEDFGGNLPSLGDATSEAPKNREDVRARERAAAAADRAVRDAWADYVPYLNLISYPLYNSPPVPSAPTNGWAASLILTIPIFDGGLRYGQDHERKALASEAHIDVEATLRQARSEVRTAFDEVQRADAALGQARQSATFATKALELATIAYRGGITTNLEVIDAQLQSLNADIQAAVAEDASRQARLDLLAASGRFPWLSPRTPSLAPR